MNDEGQLLSRLLSFSEQERASKRAAQEKALRDATNRITFIENASKRLFEEKVAGNVPESLFKKMFADYSTELSALEEKAADIQRALCEDARDEAGVQQWLELIRECAAIDKLDRATAYQLIENVAVHEQCNECGIRTQTVLVKYNFVGCLA